MLNTHYDFAEDNRAFFSEAISLGLRGNALARVAFFACLNYLKHLIAIRAETKTAYGILVHDAILRTNDLRMVIRHLQKVGVYLTAEERKAVLAIEGFDRRTAYPCEDCVPVDDAVLELCEKAVACCNNIVDSILNGEERRTVLVRP